MQMVLWWRQSQRPQQQSHHLRHLRSNRNIVVIAWSISFYFVVLQRTTQSFSISSATSSMMPTDQNLPLHQQDEVDDELSLLSKRPKSHSLTVCLVPPPERTDLWMQLQDMRRQLHDPGLYRWPPHVNLLYPFLTLTRKGKKANKDSTNNQNVLDNDDHKIAKRDEFDDVANQMDNSLLQEQQQQQHHDVEVVDDESSQVEDEMDDSMIWQRLRRATEACPPFWMTLRPFGTFGGKQRGVLWLYPTSTFDDPTSLPTETSHSTSRSNNVDDSSSLPEPVLYLHSLLQEQFPMCQAPGPSNTFHPHMTLSHFVNLTQAQEAQAQLELQQQQQELSQNQIASSSSSFCRIEEIYVLQRRGDDGQFQRIATLPLLGKIPPRGALNATSEVDNGPFTSDRSLALHDPPLPFPGMPLVEEDWVRAERKQLQKRRNNNDRGRRRRR